MERKKVFDFIEQQQFKKGGSKAACAIVYDYLHNAAPIGSSIISYESGVRNDEFLEAVGVLLAVTQNLEDTVPEKWICESDCVYSSKPYCPGAYAICKSAKTVCPYYCIEDK